MNDQPDTPSSDQPAPPAHSTGRTSRSRRARIYDALRRAWALMVGDAAAPEPAVSDDTAPHVQTPPATPGHAPHAVAKAASQQPPSSAETPPPPAENPPTDEVQPVDATSAASVTFHAIEVAARGLSFTSETDAPVEAFAWPANTPFSPEALRASAHIDAGEPLATEDIERFFRNPTTPRDWHEDAEKEQVRRFIALRDLLKSELSDISVYRFGSTAIEVYVVGRAADGSTLGIHTRVVET